MRGEFAPAAGMIFYSVFPIEGTVNDRGLILHVRESFFTASTTLVAGTTLENFMSSENPPKGVTITQAMGATFIRGKCQKKAIIFVFFS